MILEQLSICSKINLLTYYYYYHHHHYHHHYCYYYITLHAIAGCCHLVHLMV